MSATPLILLAPMEGLLDYILRDTLTRMGGVDRCVSEFIRVTNTLLPERVFTRGDESSAVVGRVHRGLGTLPRGVLGRPGEGRRWGGRGADHGRA